MADPKAITDPQTQSTMTNQATITSVEATPVGGQEDNQRILARQTPSGTSRGVQQLGGPSLSADSGNKQITVTDNVPQVLMGNQPTFGEGFFVTRQGIDATSATSPNDFIFNSNQNVFKIIKTDTFSLTLTADPISSFSIEHGQDFAPIPLAFLTNVTDGTISGNFPFPTDLSFSVDTGAGVIYTAASLRCSADATSVYFECLNATGAELGTFDIKYYLLQESSS